MPHDASASESSSDKAWGFLMGWVGRVTAIVGLCATLIAGVTWLITHEREQRERAAQLALAQTQLAHEDYQASVATYADILKSDPLDRTVLERQLDTTMLWAENFSIIIPEGQSATEPAGRMIDEMMMILESGLTRNKGTRAADVQAHLGWTHWLNQHIAEREFGPAAEENFRAALVTDPKNVYANAMLGNWMLQNNGNFSEAIQHLNSAAVAGKALPFVRKLQLGGLTGYEHPGARRELIKVANAMRVNNENLASEERRRVFGFCYGLVISDHAELVESLSAVPAQDAWLTYLWLENSDSEAASNDLQALTHDYIQANLLEISGNTGAALHQYQILQQKLRKLPSATLKDDVDEAIKRLPRT